jgi:hypothetical protein
MLERYDNGPCEMPAKIQGNDIVTRLKGRQQHLSEELAKVNEALAALEANPEIARVIKLVSATS